MRFVGTMTFAFEADDLDDGYRVARGWQQKVTAASQRTSMNFRPGTITISAQPERAAPHVEPTADPETLFG